MKTMNTDASACRQLLVQLIRAYSRTDAHDAGAWSVWDVAVDAALEGRFDDGADLILSHFSKKSKPTRAAVMRALRAACFRRK